MYLSEILFTIIWSTYTNSKKKVPIKDTYGGLIEQVALYFVGCYELVFFLLSSRGVFFCQFSMVVRKTFADLNDIFSDLLDQCFPGGEGGYFARFFDECNFDVEPYLMRSKKQKHIKINNSTTK